MDISERDDPPTESHDSDAQIERIRLWLNENHPGWPDDYCDFTGDGEPCVAAVVIAKLDWLKDLEKAYDGIRKALEKAGY